MARYIKKVQEGEIRSHLNDKRYKEESLKKKVPMKCKCCGKKTNKHYWRIKEFKYCSKECREIGKRVNNKNIKWKQLKSVIYVDLECQNPDCKKHFKRSNSYVKHKVGIKYCSKDCFGHHLHLKNIEKKMLIQKIKNNELNGISINTQISDKDSFYNSILQLNKK